jgi:hypothetical protein
MDIKAEKLSLIEWLLQLSDESVIARIKALREADVYQLSAEQKKAIVSARKEIAEGSGIPHETVMEEMKQWLAKQ